MHITAYLAANKAAAISQIRNEGKVPFIKAIRMNTASDGMVLREWLAAREMYNPSPMGLKEAKDLADLIDPNY